MNNYNFDIAFLGGLFPKETERDIISSSIGTIDNAANNLQWSLVHGLDGNLKSPVTIINSLYIGSYPRNYKKILIPDYHFSHCDQACDHNVGFLNLTGVKHLSRMFSVRPFLKRWAANDTGRPKIVIAYALTSIFVDALCFLKRKFPNVSTIMVVPDLPQYMDTTNRGGMIYTLLKTHSMRHIMRRVNDIDGFVFLTAHMADALLLKDKPRVIVEGIASSRPDLAASTGSDGQVTIAYTGTLNERYGVVNLVKAFMQIGHSNYRLVLCGSGDSEQFIVKSCAQDQRIVFKGLLQRDDIAKIQGSATILVNPRQNNEEFTKYSFPSKIMEYLSSGRPVIAYKLDGIPDEYDEHIHYVPDNSIQALADKIVEVCSQPEPYLEAFGAAARDWVKNEKNAVLQTSKITRMISEMQAGRKV